MIIPAIIHQSWHEHLQPLFDDPKMEMILNTISKINYYPAKEDVFKVFKMPLESVRVVILGQDPYPNGEGTGLAFGCKVDRNTPASLIIIKNEVMKSVYNNGMAIFGEEGYPDLVNWKSLEHWWKQGVMLLNTALTVETKSSGSHLQIWEWFTRQVIDIIAREARPVWLLWGAKAQAYKGYIANYKLLDKREDLVNDSSWNYGLEAPHPAAESYDPKTIHKFTGCNHFNKCNTILEVKQQNRIVW